MLNFSILIHTLIHHIPRSALNKHTRKRNII